MKHPTALVTGGAAGIGRAICEALLEAGYKIGVIDKDPLPPALQAFARQERLIFVQGQVYHEHAATDLALRMVEAWGGIRVLVNNAGHFEKKPLRELSLESWHEILNTNLTSYLLFAKVCEPYLRKARGRIVNIASTRALQSEADTEAYAASKGGIVALTHALSISLGPDVLVNCISPGWIDTRPAAEKKSEPLKASDHQQHPAGRVGEPSDIAAFTLWLLQEQTGFVTGQNFIVDGGMTRKMIYEE